MAKTTWSVTSVAVDQFDTSTANQVVPGSYVYYRTGEGNDGVVFIPATRFGDKTKVTNDIRASAQHLDSIAALHED
jgi:hypothetical protein